MTMPLIGSGSKRIEVKDGQINKAIRLLDEISKATPSEDDYASDWEWIKKAKELHAEY